MRNSSLVKISMILIALTAAVSSPAADRNTRTREYYYYMLLGAHNDAKAYRAIQEKLVETVKKLQAQTPVPPLDLRKIEVYRQAHSLYGELAQWHESLATELGPDKTMPNLQPAWDAIVSLELQLKALTKKDVERSWVTKTEIEALVASGRKQVFKPEGRRFPFLREHWLNKDEWQELQRKKQEALDQAAAAATAASPNQKTDR